MAKCFLFNWKALSFLSPLLVFHSGRDPGVEIERNMNRMQKASVKKHQESQEPAEPSANTTAELSGPACLFKTALALQISSHPSLVPVHPPIPSLFPVSPLTPHFLKSRHHGFPPSSPKRGFSSWKRSSLKGNCTRNQKNCLARRRGETLETLASLACPASAWAPHGFAA